MLLNTSEVLEVMIDPDKEDIMISDDNVVKRQNISFLTLDSISRFDQEY